MKKAPVKMYQPPRYPTREVFILHPRLLNAYVPLSWKGKELVAGALLSFVLGGAGKAQADAPQGKADQQQVKDQLSAEKAQQQQSEKGKYAAVAPLFVHGDGRGGTGCMAISPPVFLSEQEARQIIVQEMKKANIIFDRRDVPVEGVALEKKRITYERFDQKGKEEVIDQTPVVLDAYSTKSNIGFDFVSTAECDSFRDESNMRSSWTDYDTREMAERIKDRLRDYGKVNAVVFYDPMASVSQSSRRSWEEEGIETKKKSVELLKAQVDDFIAWVRKEGLLK